MNKIRVACIIGTRPEVIKMAPVIDALRASERFTPYIINTAQHRQLLDDMLTLFNITPDIDMNIMQHNQTLAELTGNLFIKMEALFNEQKFDLVLAQGDTTTTLVAAQVAFYHRIPFGHIEAGLRSYDLYHPFPEEMNRVFVSKIATWHFAPTTIEKDILLREQVPNNAITVTGNTVIDALYRIVKQTAPLPFTLTPGKRLVLLTLHRRESFGEPIRAIFRAIKRLAETIPDIEIVYPVHPNPNVQSIAEELLAHQPGIRLIAPQPYNVFVSLMNQAYLILSDSGGIQEEAPALDKPLLVLRDVTERPLVIELGMAKLVGSDEETIVNTATDLLTNSEHYQAMQKHESPYGDGYAAERIVSKLTHAFEKDVA